MTTTDKPAVHRVAVVGAGVLGAAIGWRLAEAGHQVVLVDPTPGGVASPGSFAWLNASFADDPIYNRLRHESLELWRELASDDPSVPVTFGGAVLWEQDHFDLDVLSGSQALLGRPAELLDGAGLAERVPAVTDPPDRVLCLLGDGYGDPVAITSWFIDRAREAGASVVSERVERVLVSDDRVIGVQTASADIDADRVVVAAGIELPDVLAGLGLGLVMANEPGLLATTSAAPKAIDTMLAAPDIHVWQRSDGRFLMGADFGGGDELDDPEVGARRVLAALDSLLDGVGECSVEAVTVRDRPIPADGRPAIGPLGPAGLYVVSTHSGMTLAPVIAACVASEVGDGQPDARLAPFRPDRPELG